MRFSTAPKPFEVSRLIEVSVYDLVSFTVKDDLQSTYALPVAKYAKFLRSVFVKSFFDGMNKSKEPEECCATTWRKNALDPTLFRVGYASSWQHGSRSGQVP